MQGISTTRVTGASRDGVRPLLTETDSIGLPSYFINVNFFV